MSLFKNLGSYIKKDKLSELTLTTNGSQLEKYAEQLLIMELEGLMYQLTL